MGISRILPIVAAVFLFCGIALGQSGTPPGPPPATPPPSPQSVPTPVPTPVYLSVPSTSSTGNYSLNWYFYLQPGNVSELEEARSSAFTNAVIIYTGTASSFQVTGKQNGTYYYRVKMTGPSYISPWIPGWNGCTVYLISPPSWINVPASSSTGAYTVQWGLGCGAPTLDVEEATNPQFTGAWRYSYPGNTGGIQLTGRPNGTYYYRVRAVANGVSSSWTGGANGCVVFLRGTLTLTQGPYGNVPAVVIAGDKDIPVLQLTLSADTVETITAHGLSIRASGTLDDAGEVDGMNLYLDVNGDGTVQPAGDTLLAGPVTFASDDGSVAFTGFSRSIPPGGSESWLVALDLATSAPTSNRFRMGFVTDHDISVTGNVSGIPIVAGAPVWGRVKFVGELGTLHVTDRIGNPVSTEVPRGSDGVEMLHLVLTTDPSEAVRISSMVIRVSGTLEDPGEFVSFQLFTDSNDNGSLDAEDERICGPVPVFPVDHEVFFAGLDEVIPPTSSRSWFVTAHVSPIAPIGARISISIENNEAIHASGLWTWKTVTTVGAPVPGHVMEITEKPDISSSSAPFGAGCAGSPSSSMPPSGALGLALLLLAGFFAVGTAKRGARGG